MIEDSKKSFVFAFNSWRNCISWLKYGRWRKDLCLDCRKDIDKLQEYAYMIRNDLWIQAGGDEGYLCISCLESRLGRNLTRDDFNLYVPLNWTPDYNRSERLLNRLSNVPESMIVERAKKELAVLREVLKNLPDENDDDYDEDYDDRWFFEWAIWLYTKFNNPYEILLAGCKDFQNEGKTLQ